MPKIKFLTFIFFSQLHLCYSSMQVDPCNDGVKSDPVHKNLSIGVLNDSISIATEADKISYTLPISIKHESNDKSQLNLPKTSRYKLFVQYNPDQLLRSVYYTIKGIFDHKPLPNNRHLLSQEFNHKLDSIQAKIQQVIQQIQTDVTVDFNEQASLIAQFSFPDDKEHYTANEISEIYKCLIGFNKFDNFLDEKFQALYQLGKPHHRGGVLIGHYRCLGESLCFQGFTIHQGRHKKEDTQQEIFDNMQNRLDDFFYTRGHLKRQ